MQKRNFTEKEKIVFYGMIKFPGLNDNTLSNIIDINPSTIATIRNKLKKNNFFKTIRIPALQYCGFELFTISYDRLYFPSISESPKSVLSNIYKRIPNIFFFISTPDSWLSMGFYQNFLNLQRINDNVRFTRNKYNLQEDTEKQVIFPFGLTKIYNFFDFSKIIQNYFGIDKELDYSKQPGNYRENLMVKNEPYLNPLQYYDIPLATSPIIKLTKVERKVLLALIQYPDLSDFAINKKISISATSVNNIRKKLESNQIIKKQIIPNLNLMGFEFISLSHLKFKSSGYLHIRERLIDELMSNIPNILYLSTNTDEIIVTAYKDYNEFQKINDEIINTYRDENILAADPRILSFPLDNSMMIKEHSYVPIVNQFLGKDISVLDSVLQIVGEKLGDTGKQILIKHLESIDIISEKPIIEDIPRLIDSIHEIISPIFGSKSAADVVNKIEQLEKIKS